MLNIYLENIELYIKKVEYSCEERPGGPNIELYIWMLNMALNIVLEFRV